MEDADSRAHEEDPYSPSIAMSHAIHALILAVDALCHHHRVPVARRHDQINRNYLDLIRVGRLPGEAARWREVIGFAISAKSRFQYEGDLTSRAEARKVVRQVGQFLAFVEDHIRSTPT